MHLKAPAALKCCGWTCRLPCQALCWHRAELSGSLSTPPAAWETSTGGRWEAPGSSAPRQRDPVPGTQVLLRMSHSLRGRKRGEVGAAGGHYIGVTRFILPDFSDTCTVGRSDLQSSKLSVRDRGERQGTGRMAGLGSNPPSLSYGGGCWGSARSPERQRRFR